MKLFGTDGIRGMANIDLTSDLAMEVAKAAGSVVKDEIDRKPTFLIATDTRISGGMLEAAVSAGLCSVCANVVLLGVAPTPAVSYLIRNGFADAGIMISASHNPYDYNGIKIFGTDGNKLTDETEFLIEKLMRIDPKPYAKCWREDIGTIRRDESLVDKYIDYLVSTVSNIDFSGVKVVVDASNGSASVTARKIFHKLGISTKIINNQPDGLNINKKCGSTHIEVVAQEVKYGDYDIGFAFDGDADRCLFVDENGEVVSGDIMLAILAADLKQQGKLKNDTLVATVMSNMGLLEFGDKNNINIAKTKVGDRYVLEEMLEKDYNFGGEQSGHVILRDYMNTGDGQLTALHLLAALKRSGSTVSKLAQIMTMYPQAMKNIKASSEMKASLRSDDGAQKIIQKAEDKLGSDGRILVRASGTEPLIRVMIEWKNSDEIQQLLEQVSDELYDRLKYY